jgi:uncharacterized membrane protein
MGQLSIWHWVIALALTFLSCSSIWRIVKRAGYHRETALVWFLFVVVVPFVGIYLFSRSNWPSDESRSR